MDNIEEVGMQDLVKRTDVTIQQAPDYLGGESDHKEPRNASYAYTGDKGRRMNGEEPRIRKIFSFAQIFFFALTFMSSWETVALNLSAALWNGGPQVLAWGTLVVVAGALAQSASLAEMASIQPIAGAQYHWTHFLAPPRHRRFITWMQGWVTWFAWVSLLAGVSNTAAALIQELLELNYPSYVPQRWHITFIIIAMLIVESLMNMYTFWVIPWIELLAGILHGVLFIIFVVVLVTLAPRHSANFVFFGRSTASGWDNSYVGWNLGLLTPTWSFVGFDGAVHMSEEVRKAKQAVPRAMFWTNVINGCLAYAFTIVVLYTMGPLEPALNWTFPIIEICLQATGSAKAATAMVCGLLTIGTSVNLASIASVSRLTWAWSRDGGLPRWFSVISPKYRVPVRALWLPVFLVMILAILNIPSTAAFGAFIALSSFGILMSYLIAIGCMLHARLSNEGIRYGGWRLGRWGVPTNIFALAYTAYVMVFLPFPSTLPVTGTNMNYALPIFAFAFFAALGHWVFWGKKNWKGLDAGVIALVEAESNLEVK